MRTGRWPRMLALRVAVGFGTAALCAAMFVSPAAAQGEPELCRAVVDSGGVELEPGYKERYKETGGSWLATGTRVEKWKEACARRYMRNNMRVLWLVGTGIAGALTAAALAWAGFVYMRESASGGDVARLRGLIVRSVSGFVFVGFAWVAWQVILVTLFGTSEFTLTSFLGFG